MHDRVRRSFGWLVMVVVLLSTLAGMTAHAQSRLSDRDVERLMQNLKEDAQPFRQSFASALKKSTIRKTSQEKDARALADTFANQAKRALEIFERKQKAESEVSALVNTAGQIDPLVYSLHLNPSTTTQWEKLRTELHQVAQAFNVAEPYFGPQPVTGSNDATSCLRAVGAQRSQQLVSECRQVSPATRPPCDAQNACSLIVDEIKRGCAMIGQGAPAFCGEYR